MSAKMLALLLMRDEIVDRRISIAASDTFMVAIVASTNVTMSIISPSSAHLFERENIKIAALESTKVRTFETVLGVLSRISPNTVLYFTLCTLVPNLKPPTTGM